MDASSGQLERVEFIVVSSGVGVGSGVPSESNWNMWEVEYTMASGITCMMSWVKIRENRVLQMTGVFVNLFSRVDTFAKMFMNLSAKYDGVVDIPCGGFWRGSRRCWG